MNYRNRNYKIPIVVDGFERSSSSDYDDYDDEDDENIMFATHSWRPNHNRNAINSTAESMNDRQRTDELSDNGGLLSMEGV